MSTGSDLIAAERLRQMQSEGWTPKHDDAHTDAELVLAAACYLEQGSGFDLGFHANWPFEPSWWKPSDDLVRNLAKAGALIAAEIDRLQREASPAVTEARASAEAPPAQPREAVRPVGCPQAFYDDVPEAFWIRITNAYFKGLGDGADLAAEAPPAAVRPPQEWQAIEGYDKAIHPLDVLVATAHGVGEARQHDDGAYGRWFWANTCDDGAPGPGEIYPTHWMPLPSPPVAVERRPQEVGIEEQKNDAKNLARVDEPS